MTGTKMLIIDYIVEFPSGQTIVILRNETVQRLVILASITRTLCTIPYTAYGILTR